MTRFGRFWAPKTLQKNVGGAPPFCILKAFVFQVMLCIASRWRKSRPRGPKTPPRAPQEAPKSAPGGFKRASRDPKSRSRGFKTRPRAPKTLPRRPQGFSEAPGPAAVFGKFKKFKSWLQKASKTLKVADIDESQRPCHKSQKEKRRAGGGDPPWGNQSAARPAGGEPSVLDPKLKGPIRMPNLQT